MDINLYYFSKRLNSTKEPFPGDPTRKSVSNVQIKQETSFLSPTLVLSKDALGPGFSPVKYNYVSIPYWQRHYYIKDWRYNPPYWEADLTVDVLASFKYVIGETSAYIVRAASSYDGNIIDTFYPATTQVNIQKIQISSDIYHTPIPGGCYVLGIVNSDTSLKVGSVTYYAMSSDQIASLLAYLFSSAIYNDSGIDEITEGMFKATFNPFQYITSCIWFPVPATLLGDTTRPIKCGYWNIPVTATVVRYVVTDPLGFKSNLPIPTHPQSNRGNYVNYAPYTRLTAYYPPFGEIPVDTTHMQYGTNNYLYGKMFIDYITGVANCYLSITDGIGAAADPYKYFTMRTAQIGVPIQLSQITTDYAGMITSAGMGLASLFTGNIGGVADSIRSGIEAATPKLGNQGANGSFIEITEPPYLIVEHYKLVDDNPSEFGRPLCKTMQINNLSGYVKCGDADHNFSATDTENQMINNFLKSGFYYE